MKAEMAVSTVSEKHTKGSSEKWLAKAPPEVHRYVLQKKNETRPGQTSPTSEERVGAIAKAVTGFALPDRYPFGSPPKVFHR